MTLAELLARAVELLDEAAIPYMVTGSLASAYHVGYIERWVDRLGLGDAWRAVTADDPPH